MTVKDSIIIGFHSCVDYELKWDQKRLEELIKSYKIHNDELAMDLEIDSARSLLIVALAHMKMGVGAEFTPSSNDICLEFANNFQYEVTVGGTAARAAIAISKIGYESSLSMVCCNKHIKDTLPEAVHYFSNVGENHEAEYPHVVFSYPANAHISVEDIDFVTPRENRMMFSRDVDSLNMVISQDFAPMMEEAKVMLLSCFSEVLEKDILKKRMEELNLLLEALPKEAFVLMEDGCYINKEFRTYVHDALRDKLSALSMNEDEMQEYYGKRINIMDPSEVLNTIGYIYKKLGVPILIVHSAAWAIAYGKHAKSMCKVLEGGTNMAATRFCFGDNFGKKEYELVSNGECRKDSIEFGEEIESLSEEEICCVASKDLRYVEHPVVVGLGDSFAGGMLPELVNGNGVK